MVIQESRINKTGSVGGEYIEKNFWGKKKTVRTNEEIKKIYKKTSIVNVVKVQTKWRRIVNQVIGLLDS